MSLTDTTEIPIQCPKCGKVHKKTFTKLKMNNKVVCTCTTVITVDLKSLQSFGKGLKDIDKALAKLGKR